MNIDSKLAIVFPGQGSQSIGMMSELITEKPGLKDLFSKASEALGYDLLEIVSSGPEEKLNKTEFTQPALLTAGYVAWTAWQEQSTVEPSMLAGHSLGEYTALVCAGVISFEDAVCLVAERGRCMQDAVPANVGAMAAILGLDDEKVIELCEQVSDSEIVSAANFNSPGQVVIAGHKTAVELAINAAKDNGAKRAMLLPVSVPSHCLLMKEAADKFATTLNNITFKDAAIPVLQNVDAVLKDKADEIKPVLLEQLYKPVRWVDGIKVMKSQGVEKIIECGPGKVLSGLIKRIDRSIETGFVMDKASLEKALT